MGGSNDPRVVDRLNYIGGGPLLLVIGGLVIPPNYEWKVTRYRVLVAGVREVSGYNR